jgi:hypothetical protein
MTRFEHVQQILDNAIGGPTVNIGVHGAFWRNKTRDQFVALKVQGRDLLVLGNGAGSNLVKALKGEAPFGADLDNPPPGAVLDRMPSGLPPVAADDIDFIQKWIDAGCPEDPFVPAPPAAAGRAVPPALQWRPTNAPVASSRTDDIWFLDPDTGWAVNSNGQIVRTTDGGDTWVEQLHDPEVYFRCIGFASATRGWAGTLTAPKTLFETRDGGASWTPVTDLPALAPSAVCGMSVVNESVVYLSGTNFPNRPPRMMKTTDGGATWRAWDMRPWASILIDCYFPSPDRGWVVGGKADEPVATRNNVVPVVLFTADGGRTWQNQVANLHDQFPKGEWGWKIQFLDDRVGFVSLENFTQGAILKTTDGGRSWTRLPVNDPQGNANLEGVGFVDENHGWVGGWGDRLFQRLSSSETTDGGRTWVDASAIGKALNRFRFFGKPVTVGYASGQTVYKYAAQPAATTARTPPRTTLLADNRPSRATGPLLLPVTVPAGIHRLAVRVWDRFGDHVATPVDEVNPAPGPRLVPWVRQDATGRHLDPGYYIVRVTADRTSESQLVHLGAAAPAGLSSPSSPQGVSNMATSHVVLPGSERPLLPGSKVLGPADPDQVLEITLKLRRKAPLPDPAQRQQVSLDRAAFAAQYGASSGDIATVKQVLGRYGLEVVSDDPATRSVEVTGPVHAIEQAFQVKLFRCAYEDEHYRARSRVIHLPAELAGIVVGVFGLDDRRVARRRRPRVAPRPAALSLAGATHRGFFPAELGRLYDFPDGDGADQVIGILEFGGGFLLDDLRRFCQAVNVDVPTVVPVSVDHTPTDLADDDAVEVMLDIEVIAGLCPKATIPVYFGHFTERGWIRILDAAVHDPHHNLSVLSISWGAPEEGEPLWTQQGIDAVNESLQEAALRHITVCVASGDDGSDDQVGDGLAHVDFPASSPFVLGVGGTDLRSRQGQVTERCWKDGDGLRADGGGSSGGGVSNHFARPTWQAGIDITSVNPGAPLGRVVPDVAAHAQSDGQTTGYFMVFGGRASPNGGTSASAPLWAALVARLNAALNKRVGYVTPLLYQAAQGGSVGSAGCKDITEGDNISAAGGGYRARAGYDAVTGWGSPRGRALLAALGPLL